MQHRKLSTTLAILATAAGVSAFTASAQAVVVDNDPASLTSDPEVTLNDANLAFDFGSGTTIPTLTGTLAAVNADDACVRVRIDSYDGATFLHSKPGTKHCLTNDLLHEFSVNLAEDGDALTDRVVVKVEKENTQGWSTQDEREIVMNTFTDSFTILGAGIDIGGDGFAAGVPASSATVSWPVIDGQVTASYEGRVHFDGFSRCGRVRLRYLDESGAQLDAIPGPQHCPPDLAHYGYKDVIAGAPSALVTQVEVQMQSKSGGSWNTVDSETVSIAE